MSAHLIELSHIITAGMITRLHAAPLRITGFGTVSVRAYACVRA